MTDFVSDLEAELLAAARRRAHQPRRARLRLPLRPLLAATAVIAAVVLVPKGQAERERQAAPAGQGEPAHGDAPRPALPVDPPYALPTPKAGEVPPGMPTPGSGEAPRDQWVPYAPVPGETPAPRDETPPAAPTPQPAQPLGRDAGGGQGAPVGRKARPDEPAQPGPARPARRVDEPRP